MAPIMAPPQAYFAGWIGAQAMVALNWRHQISTDFCLLRSIEAGIT